MLTMLTGPVAADECSNYRNAFVLHEVAERASVEHLTTPEYLEAQRRALFTIGVAASRPEVATRRERCRFGCRQVR